jgi:hypothetical protein
MAASDNLNEKLFHGTAHWFQPGDIVTPGTRDSYYNRDGFADGRTNRHKGVAAYATEDLYDAKSFAASKLISQEVDEVESVGSAQMALFAPVFEVEHVSEHHDPENVITNKMVRRDPKGFRIKGIAGYGIPGVD